LKLKIIWLAFMISIFFSCNDNKSGLTPQILEGYVQTEDGKVWYKIIGTDKPGIPLLVVHGGPGAPHDYLEPLGDLANERPVVFYDQLGCGNSDRPSDSALWSVQRFVNELETVRKHLNLESVHILGQSWGTMLSVEYILRKNPVGVRSLILSAPYLSTPRWKADQKLLIAKLPENIRNTITEHEQTGDYSSPAYQEAMSHFYNLYLCRLDPWPDCLNRTMTKMGIEVYNYMWGPSEFTMTGTLKNADLTGKLKYIKVPVLFTCGEFDEATPATTEYFKDKLPGSEIRIFSGASHSHHLEKRNAYLDTVRDFLDRCEVK